MPLLLSCISLVEEAIINGGTLKLNFEAKKITKNKNNEFEISNTDLVE